MTLTEATALVTASGLKTGSITTAASPATPMFANPNPVVPTVVGQTPAPGTRVTTETTVQLQVVRS
jgi:beta-lactam-binding protein with PASTA domain